MFAAPQWKVADLSRCPPKSEHTQELEVLSVVSSLTKLHHLSKNTNCFISEPLILDIEFGTKVDKIISVKKARSR